MTQDMMFRFLQSAGKPFQLTELGQIRTPNHECPLAFISNHLYKTKFTDEDRLAGYKLGMSKQLAMGVARAADQPNSPNGVIRSMRQFLMHYVK